MKGTVYLLHFSQPYKHAKHYLGWTKNLEERIIAHRNGCGARLLEVITAAGITFIIAITWEGTRKLERKLKSWKNSVKLCPICKALNGNFR